MCISSFVCTVLSPHNRLSKPNLMITRSLSAVLPSPLDIVKFSQTESLIVSIWHVTVLTKPSIRLFHRWAILDSVSHAFSDDAVSKPPAPSSITVPTYR